MGRPQLYSEDSILDAARAVVLERGARAATIGAIATASGAPKGSIYHRFPSREDLLGAMWIRAVRRSQAAFIEALADPVPLEAAVAGALSLHDFAINHPADARLLAALRREDILERISSPELRRQLGELNRPLQAALATLARRLFGRARPTNLERTLCAVIDLPIGATRRHLIAGAALPSTLRDQLEAAVRAALTPQERSPDVREG
jgi:AcrR family transcriptional regulator